MGHKEKNRVWKEGWTEQSAPTVSLEHDRAFDGNTRRGWGKHRELFIDTQTFCQHDAVSSLLGSPSFSSLIHAWRFQQADNRAVLIPPSCLSSHGGGWYFSLLLNSVLYIWADSEYERSSLFLTGRFVSDSLLSVSVSCLAVQWVLCSGFIHFYIITSSVDVMISCCLGMNERVEMNT